MTTTTTTSTECDHCGRGMKAPTEHRPVTIVTVDLGGLGGREFDVSVILTFQNGVDLCPLCQAMLLQRAANQVKET